MSESLPPSLFGVALLVGCASPPPPSAETIPPTSLGDSVGALIEEDASKSAPVIVEGSVAPEGYRTPSEVLREIRNLSGAEVSVLATSPGDREVLVATVGTSAPGRPEVLIVADPTGMKPVASEVALALAKYVAKGGGMLAESSVFHVVALANPDAAASMREHGVAGRGRPMDADRDGRLDEDGPDDFDGDGVIRTMRVPDLDGGWLAGDDARSSRKAEAAKGEFAVFRLEQEGTDLDGDRLRNEDAAGGVVYEANWPHGWDEYARNSGAFALSEPETRGLADFVIAHPNIALVVVLGDRDNFADPEKGGGNGLRGATNTLEGDVWLLKVMKERLYGDEENLPQSAGDPKGTFAAWAYFQRGLPVLESSIWTIPTSTGDGSDEEKQLAWNDAALGGEGFMDWKEVDHPQLGSVEVGGWLPFVRGNPPHEYLDGIVDRWVAFADSWAQDFAALKWVKVQEESQGEGVIRLRATLANVGLLPTASDMGLKTRRPFPVRVKLELPEGAQILAGSKFRTIPRLGGRGGQEEMEWLLHLPNGGDWALHARSETAGVARVSQGEKR